MDVLRLARTGRQRRLGVHLRNKPVAHQHVEHFDKGRAVPVRGRSGRWRRASAGDDQDSGRTIAPITPRRQKFAQLYASGLPAPAVVAAPVTIPAVARATSPDRGRAAPPPPVAPRSADGDGRSSPGPAAQRCSRQGSGEENSGDQQFHGALQRGCPLQPAIGYGLQMFPDVQAATKSVMKIPLAFSVIFTVKYKVI